MFVITPYEILEHPSELRIRVYGKTLEELFSNAALAMAQILSKETKFEIKDKKPKIKDVIKVESVDLNSLLVDFLSEILALSQINRSVYQVLSFKFQDSRLKAQLAKHSVTHFDEDIKAVTYEDLDIKKVDGRWETMIVFDI